MFLNQFAEFLLIGQEFVLRSQHPADLQPGYGVRLAQGKKGFNAKNWCSLSMRTDLTQSMTVQNGVFKRICVIGLAEAGLLETRLLIKSSGGNVRFPNLEKHGTAVGFAGRAQQGV